MSKLNITNWEDKNVTPEILGALFEAFLQTAKEFPASIIVTEDQWQKFFYAANERLTNFRGVPLELPEKANAVQSQVQVIDAILKGMHISGARDIFDVYRNLENMKVKLGG